MAVPEIDEQVTIVKKLIAKTDISIENGAYAINSDWFKKFNKNTPNIYQIRLNSSRKTKFLLLLVLFHYLY